MENKMILKICTRNFIFHFQNFLNLLKLVPMRRAQNKVNFIAINNKRRQRRLFLAATHNMGYRIRS